MEPNLSFLASRPVSPAANETSAAPAAPASGAAHSEKSDFAQVLNGQTLKAQRQYLAAVEAPGQGLQVVPLGNKINVITSDAPLPDMASLAKFARMQGLDEAAVQALFGSNTETKVSALGQSTAAADALTASLASADPLGLAGAPVVPTANDVPMPPITLIAPIIAAVPAPVAATAPLAVPQTGGAASAESLQALLNSPEAQALQMAVERVSVSQSVPMAPITGSGVSDMPLTPPRAAVMLPTPLPTQMPLAPTDANTTDPMAPALVASAAQSSLLPMQPNAWIGKAGVAQVESTDISAPLSPQDAVRLTLAMPAPEITKRLAQMSGTGKETTWAALLASGPAAKDLPAATDTVTLELPAGFDADLLAPTPDTSLSQPSDLSTQAGAGAPAAAAMNTAGAAGGGNAGNAQAQADHRAQQFQQLADQMGQAAAQRLMAQIERGQWKMQMRMQPASLGSINVELDMHAGGLDALFSTDNAVTRDLMAQGSNKLRDTLTQSGMTVASVTVNGEQRRQSGGNSTPGKGRQAPFASPAASVMAGAAATAQAAPVAENDGLNLLA